MSRVFLTPLLALLFTVEIKSQSGPLWLKSQVIAHRGISNEAPENSLPALIDAKGEIKWYEIDIRRTKDNVLIVFHDETLERTTNGTGRVKDHTFAQLQALSAGNADRFGNAFSHTKIPSLKQVLTARGPNQMLVLDLKIYNNLVAIVDLIDQHDAWNFVIFQSPEQYVLETFLQADDRAKVQFLVNDFNLSDVCILEQLSIARYFGIAYNGLTSVPNPDLVKSAQRLGIRLAAYTLNQEVDVQNHLEAGANFVITDRPRKFKNLADRFQNEFAETQSPLSLTNYFNKTKYVEPFKASRQGILQLFDANLQMIWSNSVKQDEFIPPISLEPLANGLYFMYLSTECYTLQKKIIIQH